MTDASDTPDAFEALRTDYEPLAPPPEFAATLRQRLWHVVAREGSTTTGSGGGTMSNSPEAGGATPAEPHALTPYLVVSDARRAIEFYVAVFGASRRGEPIVMDDGRVGHAEVAIGDSVLMLAEEFPEIDHVAVSSGGPAVRVEVADVDTAVARTVELGGEAFGEVADDGHGRTGRIRDPFGQRWLVQQAPHRSSAGRPRPRHGKAAYFTFTVPDDEAATAFYGAVLGWQFAGGGRPRTWGVIGSGLPDAGLVGEQDYAGWKLMYAVDDLDSAVTRVRTAGGTVRSVTDEPYGRVADCVDDQGVEFWLVQL